MCHHSINIITGKIGSGKTTYLQKCFTSAPNCYGILTPVILGERIFQNIETGEQFPTQSFLNDEEIVAVGRFRFSKMAFEKASAILASGLEKREGTLILDEIGPLELRKEGFYDVAQKMLQNTNPDFDKFIVVRESILPEVIQFFNIKNYQVITVPSL